MVGGSLDLVTQTQPQEHPLGGTTLGGRALFGVRVAPRVSIEFEPSFSGHYSREYTYRAGASFSATVTATRRDSFFPVQVRVRAKALEPVFGVGVVRSTIARHATTEAGIPYFDDSRADNKPAFVGGLDLALKVAPHAFVVPTFRVRIGPSASTAANDPLGEQTTTGFFNFRYGVGMRIGF